MRISRNNKLTKNKRIFIIILIGLLVIIGTSIISSSITENNQEIVEPNVTSNYRPEETTAPVEQQVKQPDKSETKTESKPEPVSKWPVTYTTEQASSLTVVVNKKYKLPQNYAPGLRSEASNAINQLINDAANSGINLKIISSYRSYDKQQSTYQGWVARDGQAAADTYSARPGHSEHQTGLAIDVGVSNGLCDLEICFGNTPEGKWVAENAKNYGFIIRYPNGKEAVTGYQYEPWHLRFIGIEEATKVEASGQTLEQYYGLEGGGY
jgi:D-alanyl-D-alanine carboxypeptidase